MKNQKGFTLIELLLVLAIIGIISAIAIPALLGQREAARNRATQSNASNVAGAIQVAIGIVEDEPAGSRSVSDLDTAASIANILSAVSARSEYANMKNPFTPASSCYTFGAAPTVPGQVGCQGTTINGQSVVQIRFITKVKGSNVTNILPKSPESSLPL